MMEPGKDYYHERDFAPCPKPEGRKISKERTPQPRIKMSHRALTKLGVPAKKDGCKLGLRKRLALMSWYEARLI